jgi:hypothetical protein
MSRQLVLDPNIAALWAAVKPEESLISLTADEQAAGL